MEPHGTVCPNAECPAKGQTGKGNVHVHSHSPARYRCSVCRKTFSAREGAVFFRLHSDPNLVTLVLTLVAHGCPIAAIHAGFGFQARTVRSWVEKAGGHCEEVHESLVVQPRVLGQVQADELRVKTQSGIVWVALALAVPCRLWLGAVLAPSRDRSLIRALIDRVRAGALEGPLLVVTDGFSAYGNAIRRAFRTPVRTGEKGAPRKVPWRDLGIGRIVKRYQKRRVTTVDRQIVRGTPEQIEAQVAATQGEGGLNTAFIERLNATFRSRLFCLVRRTRSVARRHRLLQTGVYLVGTVYNFCTFHQSLSLTDPEIDQKEARTPAIAAGLTDHRWTVRELLEYRAPPPRWQPPRRRGRKSKQLLALIQQWAS